MPIRTGWNDNSMLLTEEELLELENYQKKLEEEQDTLKTQIGQQVEGGEVDTVTQSVDVSGDGTSFKMDELQERYALMSKS